MLEGLRLPLGDEEVPGTLRRSAFAEFEIAASEFRQLISDGSGAITNSDGAYAAAIEQITGRVDGAAVTITVAHEQWDNTEGTLEDDERASLYRATEEALEGAVNSLAADSSALRQIIPPESSARSHDALELATDELARSAADILAALRLPLEDEAVPGTLRRDAFAQFQALLGSFSAVTSAQ